MDVIMAIGTGIGNFVYNLIMIGVMFLVIPMMISETSRKVRRRRHEKR